MGEYKRGRAAQLLAEKTKQRDDLERELRRDHQAGTLTRTRRTEAEALLKQLGDDIRGLRLAARHA